jgi:hypothetical protein
MPEGTVMKAIIQDTYGSGIVEFRELAAGHLGLSPHLTGGGVHVRACRHCARRRHGHDRRLVAKPDQNQRR